MSCLLHCKQILNKKPHWHEVATEVCHPILTTQTMHRIISRTDQTLIVVATSNAQHEPQAVQSLSVSEVPTPHQGNTPFYVYHWCVHAFHSDFTVPTPDSPSNPFISTDSLPPSEGFLHHPHPPTSLSKESFAEPSPSCSISGLPPPRSCGSP